MAEPYCFGRFMLDPSASRLCADGVPVRLGSTEFRVLLALVERDGALITRDELVSRVWGGAAIGDNALRVHIMALRRIVGDDCIVTKRGSGYRFTAQVLRGRKPAQQPREPLSGNLASLWISDAEEGPARLIGRSDELRIVSEFLSHGRLVTLTGPGGVGKTSLALHAAGAASHHFHDGVWLVELAALNDPDLVPGAVATVLGIKLGQNSAPVETIARQLARKSLLIVLDNCEHVVAAAAAFVETLLWSAPQLKILATSREPLSCMGEQVFEVPSLAVPREGLPTSEAVRATPAVALFLERAGQAHSGFLVHEEEVPIVARICRRLDGLPLAIEMAAGWAGVLGIGTLDARLRGSLDARLRARSTAPLRHSTMRATLEWSYDLLTAAERAALRRLAVFARSFTMADAETVIADDDLSANEVLGQVVNLARKSMIAIVPESGVRHYRFLETTRAFALERLAESKDAEAVRERHAAFVLHQLERAMEEWETTGDAVWLDRHVMLLDDLRAVLDWALHRNASQAIAIAGASWLLWREMALHAEGRKWLAAAATHLGADTPAHLEARLRRALGELWSNTAHVKLARDEFERAVFLYRVLDDGPQLGSTLSRLAFAQLILGESEEAKKSIAEAMCLLDERGVPHSLTSAYSTEICVEARLGGYERVCAVGARAMGLCEAIGADRVGLVIAGNLMEFALERGDVDTAVRQGRELATRLRDTSHSDLQGFVLGLLAAALTEYGDLEEALTVAHDAAPVLRDEGMLIVLLDHLALRAGLAGRASDAARILGYADSVYRASARPREPSAQQAANRLLGILTSAIPADEIRLLGRDGEKLSEDQVLALALRE